jgi:sugar phosphate isomerase/epimerase
MKIALCSGSFKPEIAGGTCTVYDILTIAEKYGFSGLEVREDILNNKPADLPKLKELATEKDIELIYAYVNWPVNKDVVAMQENAMTLIQRMDEAVALGSSLLKTGFGPVDNFDELKSGHFKVLEELAEAAETRNITLCLENSDKSSGSNASTIRDIVARVNSASLQITYDAGNFAIAGKNPVAALETMLEHVAYVHLKDVKKGEMVNTYMGNGDVDYAAIFRILQAVGYRGYGCFEFSMNTGRLIEVEKSISYMKDQNWN